MLEQQLRDEVQRANEEAEEAREAQERDRAELEGLRVETKELKGKLKKRAQEVQEMEAESDGLVAQVDRVKLQLDVVKAESKRKLEQKTKEYNEAVKQLEEQTSLKDEALDALSRTESALIHAGVPLSDQERQMIVQLMHERADKRLDEATSAHEGRIRELSQLIALRDRQLSGALARAASAPKALNKRPLTPSSAGLLVTPSLPEAKGGGGGGGSKSGSPSDQMFITQQQHLDGANRHLTVSVPDDVLGYVLSEASAQMSARSRPGSARWSSPFKKRMGPTPASEVPVPLLVSSSAATLYPSPGRGGIERPGSPARPPSANVQQRSAFAQHVAHRQQQRPATAGSLRHSASLPGTSAIIPQQAMSAMGGARKVEWSPPFGSGAKKQEEEQEVVSARVLHRCT